MNQVFLQVFLLTHNETNTHNDTPLHKHTRKIEILLCCRTLASKKFVAFVHNFLIKYTHKVIVMRILAKAYRIKKLHRRLHIFAIFNFFLERQVPQKRTHTITHTNTHNDTHNDTHSGTHSGTKSITQNMTEYDNRKRQHPLL